MALTEFANGTGIVMNFLGQYPVVSSETGIAANLAGESTSFIGEIYLSSGTGTSKTISSAGGKIWFSIGSSTVFTTAGSTLRVGIQDVNATGVDDGTYDVYDDLVATGDTLTSNTLKEVVMSSGTKTITHGDKIAVVVEMTVRNGADSVTINKWGNPLATPYAATDTGGGPVKAANSPNCVIQFDDGTVGHFGDLTLPFIETNVSFNDASTPDEYGIIFQVPFKCSINALGVRLSGVAATEYGVMALISSPLVTPADILTVSASGDYMIASGTLAYGLFGIAETTLNANTTYGITYRPTSGSVRAITQVTIPHADVRKAMMFGETLQGISRTNLGAFTPSTTVLPEIIFRISKLDDGEVTTAEVSFISVG